MDSGRFSKPLWHYLHARGPGPPAGQTHAVTLYHQKGKTAEFFYTYDNQATAEGISVAQKLAEWEAKGKPGSVQERAEVVALILDGLLANKVCLLAIPTTATCKLAGYRDLVKLVHGRRLQQVITRVSVGDPVRTRDGNIRPWLFDLAGLNDAAP